MSDHHQSISLITDELSRDECKRLFYLCGVSDTDIISTDLRPVLKSVLCQMSYTILTELIMRIKRYDLLKDVLMTNKCTVEGMLKNKCSISDYRILMNDVSDDLDSDDLKSLTFLLSDVLPKHKLEHVQSFLDVVVELEKVDLLSSEKTDQIEHLLRSIHRSDLAKKIRRYQEKASITKPGGSSPPTTLKLKKAALPSPMIDILSTCHNVPKFCDNRTAVRKQPLNNQIEVYSMKRDCRGLCYIIDCVGTEGDQLEKTFKNLHFRVIQHKLLSVEDILSTLKDAARHRDHHNSSAFICCIISRSHSSDLLSIHSHGPGLNLETIRRFFKPDSCPGLAGKPKLFFIQSYEVSDSERCVVDYEDYGYLETDGPVDKSVPADADIFWSHCWTKAQHLETPNHQSIYLQALRSALDKGQKRRTHLIDAHTSVNHDVYKHNNTSKESYFINLRHTLRKNVYLT